MGKTSFEVVMDRVLYGGTQKNQSKKLRKLAGKITKTPDSINIPIEYMIGDES